MKRTVIILSLIFALAIALSVSIPTLAAAPNPIANTTITGKVPKAIDVSATASAILTPENILPGVESSAAVTVTVSSNYGWKLYVKGSDSGKMHRSSAATTLLHQYMKVAGDDLLKTDLTGADQQLDSGATVKAGVNTATFYQTGDWDDTVADDYTITITFTGTNN